MSLGLCNASGPFAVSCRRHGRTCSTLHSPLPTPAVHVPVQVSSLLHGRVQQQQQQQQQQPLSARRGVVALGASSSHNGERDSAGDANLDDIRVWSDDQSLPHSTNSPLASSNSSVGGQQGLQAAAAAAAAAAASLGDASLMMSSGKETFRDSDDERAAFFHAFPGYMQSAEEEEGSDGFYQDSSVQGDGLGAAAQHLWQRVRSEAVRESASEPLLNMFFVTNILQHDTFEAALAYILASSLASSLLTAVELDKLFRTTFAEEKSLISSALADAEAFYRRDPACSGYCQVLLHRLGYHAIQVQRVAHHLWLRKHKDLALTLQSRMSEVYAVDIHPGASLGRGMLLDHGTGVVIGETAVIGNNCSLLQNITLGGTGKESGDRHPKIMDNVLIGACSSILGNIVIGKGAQVGAGSLVLKAVAPHTMVAGSPSKVVGQVQGNPALRMQHDNSFIRQKRAGEEDLIIGSRGNIYTATQARPSSSAPPRDAATVAAACGDLLILGPHSPPSLSSTSISNSTFPTFPEQGATNSSTSSSSTPTPQEWLAAWRDRQPDATWPAPSGSSNPSSGGGSSSNSSPLSGAAVSTSGDEPSASASVQEARAWIAAWRAKQPPAVAPPASASAPSTSQGDATARTAGAAVPPVLPQVLEARAWIAAWRAHQQQQVTATAAQAPVPAGAAAAAAATAANVLQARAWIAAWRAVQQQQGHSDAASAAAATLVTAAVPTPANVLEARQWIAAWRALQPPKGSSAQTAAHATASGDLQDVGKAAPTVPPASAFVADAKAYVAEWLAKQQQQQPQPQQQLGAAAGPASPQPSGAPSSNSSPLPAANVAEARAWIAAWRSQQSSSSSSSSSAPSYPIAQPAHAPSAEQLVLASAGALANVAEARAWIAAWRSQQSSSSSSSSSSASSSSAAQPAHAPSAGAPANVAEARAWIAAWRAADAAAKKQADGGAAGASSATPPPSTATVSGPAGGGESASAVSGLERAVGQVRRAAGEAWLAARRRILEWRAKQQGLTDASLQGAAATPVDRPAAGYSSSKIGGREEAAASSRAAETAAAPGDSGGALATTAAAVVAAAVAGPSDVAVAMVGVPENVAAARAWIAAWRSDQQAREAPATPQQQQRPPQAVEAAQPPAAGSKKPVDPASQQEPEYYL